MKKEDKIDLMLQERKKAENHRIAILRTLQGSDTQEPRYKGHRLKGDKLPKYNQLILFSYEDLKDLEKRGLIETDYAGEEGAKLKAQFYRRKDALYQETNPRNLGAVYEITPEGIKALAKLQRGKKHPVEYKIVGNDLVSRVSSFIFLFAGLVFMALPDFTTTENIIGLSSTSNIPFFLSLGLIIIGGVLLFRSFKK